MIASANVHVLYHSILGISFTAVILCNWHNLEYRLMLLTMNMETVIMA